MPDYPHIPPLVYLVRGLGILCTGLAIGGGMALVILNTRLAILLGLVFCVAGVVALAGKVKR